MRPGGHPVRLPWLVLYTLVLAPAGCQRHPPAPVVEPATRYVVGAPWQGLDGAWFYPKEQFELHQTGLAVVERAHGQPLTMDGERYDPTAVAAAHQTLQLPAIVRVTNLENGRRLSVRVNDRGPPSPGRVLALTPAAASLLGMQPGISTRVALDLDPGLSRAVASQAAGGPHLDIIAAPVEGVQEQSLGPPGEPGPDQAAATGPAPVANAADRPAEPAAIVPAAVQQGLPNPRALWIDAGQFSQRGYAAQVAATVGGRVESEGSGRETVYNVRVGPVQSHPRQMRPWTAPVARE